MFVCEQEARGRGDASVSGGGGGVVGRDAPASGGGGGDDFGLHGEGGDALMVSWVILVRSCGIGRAHV